MSERKQESRRELIDSVNGDDEGLNLLNDPKVSKSYEDFIKASPNMSTYQMTCLSFLIQSIISTVLDQTAYDRE